MKLNILKHTIILLIAISGISFSQNVENVKAVVGDLPSAINAGESVKFSVTITNTGSNTWSSDKLSAKETGPFDIKKDGNNNFNLEPGQSQTLYFIITAPDSAGKKKCKVYFYTTGKKIGSKQKSIQVNGTTPGKK